MNNDNNNDNNDNNDTEIIKVVNIKHPDLADLADYVISRDGQIFDKDLHEKKSYIKNGYYNITINNTMYAVHRLVAMTFIPNPNNYPVVNHIDENKLNNNATNLEWCTQQDNCNSHSKTTSHVRKVIQLNLDNTVVKIHNSVTEAGISVGLTRHAINKVCSGHNNTAGGFKWKYENQEHNYETNVDLTNAKPVIDFPNYYVFSNGKIYNAQRKAFMKDCINEHGSHYITLSSGTQKKKNKYIHNLVATYFIQNPKNLKNVRHINGDKNDNDVSNLEWF